MSGQALPDGTAAPGSGQNLLPFGADPTEGSLSTYQNQTGADSYTLCHNRGSLLPAFAGYATKEALISQGIASYRK